MFHSAHVFNSKGIKLKRKLRSSHIHERNHTLHVFNSIFFPPYPYHPLLTQNIKSLYIIIPENNGLLAIQYFLNRRPDSIYRNSTIFSEAQLVFILKIFTRSREIYQQVSGVTMRRRLRYFGPTNLLLDLRQNNMLSNTDRHLCYAPAT